MRVSSRDPAKATGGDLRVIPECRELSSLSSLPDDFLMVDLPNWLPTIVLGRGTALASTGVRCLFKYANDCEVGRYYEKQLIVAVNMTQITIWKKGRLAFPAPPRCWIIPIRVSLLSSSAPASPVGALGFPPP